MFNDWNHVTGERQPIIVRPERDVFVEDMQIQLYLGRDLLLARQRLHHRVTDGGDLGFGWFTGHSTIVSRPGRSCYDGMMSYTRDIFLDKLRHKLAERGYVGEALETKLAELLARPLPPAAVELMRNLKRDMMDNPPVDTGYEAQ